MTTPTSTRRFFRVSRVWRVGRVGRADHLHAEDNDEDIPRLPASDILHCIASNSGGSRWKSSTVISPRDALVTTPSTTARSMNALLGSETHWSRTCEWSRIGTDKSTLKWTSMYPSSEPSAWTSLRTGQDDFVFRGLPVSSRGHTSI